MLLLRPWSNCQPRNNRGSRNVSELPIANWIENQKSRIHHSGTFSTKLATPIFSASGIFELGLRILAR